jgi:hemoglobin
MTTPTQATPYALLGGEAGVRQLVHRFYELMDELPEAWSVRRLHPDSLKNSEENLFEYLSGWFGGPTMYTDKKGHPRMRMRHAPYAVTPTAKDEWMMCMTQSLTEQVQDVAFRDHLIATFAQLADHMVNTA